MQDQPKVLFVARTRYRLPLEGGLLRKFSALEAEMSVRVLASSAAAAPPRDETFHLVPPRRPRLLDGPLFYTELPWRVAREVREFRPDTIIAQGPHAALAALAGRALAGRPVRVVLEVHGDWRTMTRLYGSRARRLLAPLADAAALAGLRRADAVRTVSHSTSQLVREYGVEPAAEFPAYLDVTTFLSRPPQPLPDHPLALFVGVLERYKNVDALVGAWRMAAPRLPGVCLHVVGDGSMRHAVADLAADLPEQVRWSPQLAAEDVARALDQASLLVLPSRSEGLPRIALEALCRGRPVLGARAGGIPDLLIEGENGFLLERSDPETLAEVLTRVLSDREALERVASSCRATVEAWLPSPEGYARRVRELVTDGAPGRVPLAA